MKSSPEWPATKLQAKTLVTDKTFAKSWTFFGVSRIQQIDITRLGKNHSIHERHCSALTGRLDMINSVGAAAASGASVVAHSKRDSLLGLVEHWVLIAQRTETWRESVLY